MEPGIPVQPNATPVTGALLDGRGRVAKRTSVIAMAIVGVLQTLQHPPAWLDTLIGLVQAFFASRA